MKRTRFILCLTISFVTFGALINNASSSKFNRDSLTDTTATAIEDNGLKRAKDLISIINQYRREQGLDEIPFSPWLTNVAIRHVNDLETNKPNQGSCNLHSWSNKGSWSPCCYTGDSSQLNCIWNKPREISKGAYKGNGYEIAAGPGEITNRAALEAWKRSPIHLNTILNRGVWANTKWKAIGVGISSHYIVVWFGEEPDLSAETSIFKEK